MEGTFWALVPTLVAVVFALITKEVFISLFVGIFTGAMLIAGGNPITALSELFGIMAAKTGPDVAFGDGGNAQIVGLGNAGILIFIIELGIIVALMNKSGGTAAFGKMITRRVKSDKSALLTTTALGCIIFMDDYFNRLAIGSIMRPVADKYDISRVKLAYIIGSVSVSICILIPISSWASAITGNIGEGLTDSKGAFDIYLNTLLCNFYPILTLLFLFISPLLGIDLFKKRIAVANTDSQVEIPESKGRAIDLIFPIAVLIILSIVFMTTSYASETILVMSGAITILLCFALYLPRKVMTVKEFTDCLSSGFKSIADVVIILVFAWTLTGVCEKLDVGTFVQSLTAGMGQAQTLLPAILFVAAMGTAFSTGTAWGTFGMLVPLTVPMFEAYSTLQILSIAAVLSGSVFGNQVSPISDSTLLASKVCMCDHMTLIKAQLPGALLIASIAFCGFLVAGVTSLIWLGWIVAITLFATLVLVTYLKKRPHVHKEHKTPNAEILI